MCLRWLKDLKNNAESNVTIMLVGNKLDLCNKNPSMRRVSQEEGMRLAEENGLLFEETSSLDLTNVNRAFERVLEGYFFLVLLMFLADIRIEISKKKSLEIQNKAKAIAMSDTHKHGQDQKCCKIC